MAQFSSSLFTKFYLAATLTEGALEYRELGWTDPEEEALENLEDGDMNLLLETEEALMPEESVECPCMMSEKYK